MKKLLYLALLIILFTACKKSNSLDFQEGWEYRKGFNASWLNSYNPSDYKKIKIPVVLKSIKELKNYKGELLLRKEIPQNIINSNNQIAFSCGPVSDVIAEFYVNNTKFAEAGSYPDEIAYESIIFKTIPMRALNQHGQNAIYIKIYSTDTFDAEGLSGPILLGNTDSIFYKSFLDMIIHIILIVIITTISFYHLFIGIRLPEEKYNIFFGLFLLSFTISFFFIFIAQANNYFSYIFSLNSIRRIDCIAYILGTVAFVFFISHFLENKHRQLTIYWSAFCLFLIVINIFAPIHYIKYTVRFWIGSLMIIIPYIIYIVTNSVIKKNRDAINIFFGFIILILSIIHDILATLGLITKSILGLYALLFFILFVVINLINKYVLMHIELGKLKITLKTEVEERTEELNDKTLLLAEINDKLLRSQEKLWSEIELAEKIQISLLPQETNIPGYIISPYIKPAHLVGGDFYDVINVEGYDWLIIGDVIGHGIPAGLIMMMIQTIVHATVEHYPNIEPDELIVRANSTLYNNLQRLDESLFSLITVFTCDKNGNIYFSGLHQDIPIYRKKTKKVELIETIGFWLGAKKDIKEHIEKGNFKLDSGDVMLLFSDGIVESWKKGTVENYRNPHIDMYGRDRLIKNLLENGEKTPNEIKESLINSMENYDQKDDVTIVVVKKV